MQLYITQHLTYTKVLIDIADPPYICLICHQLWILCLRAECCPTIFQDSKHRAVEEWIQFCRFIWKNIQDACTMSKTVKPDFLQRQLNISWPRQKAANSVSLWRNQIIYHSKFMIYTEKAERSVPSSMCLCWCKMVYNAWKYLVCISESEIAYHGFLAMWQSITVGDQTVILQTTTVINEVQRAQCVFFVAKPYSHSMEL